YAITKTIPRPHTPRKNGPVEKFFIAAFSPHPRRESRSRIPFRNVIALAVPARLHATYIMCSDCRRAQHVWLQENRHAQAWRSAAGTRQSDPHRRHSFCQSPSVEGAISGRHRKGDV